MGKKQSEKDLIENIVNDARESFDVGDFLRGRSVRTRKVRAFTDEVTAEQRGGYENTTETLPNGITVPSVRSWGVVKDLAEAQSQYEDLGSKGTKEGRDLKAKIKTLTDEIKSLTAKLLETSLEIELQAIPKEIKKDAWKAAKKALGINGKVPEHRLDDMIDEHAAQLLSRTVVSITKEETGERNEGASLATARSLKGFLPDSEWDKIEKALDELLVERVIAEQAVSDPDFSPGT